MIRYQIVPERNISFEISQQLNKYASLGNPNLVFRKLPHIELDNGTLHVTEGIGIFKGIFFAIKPFTISNFAYSDNFFIVAYLSDIYRRYPFTLKFYTADQYLEVFETNQDIITKDNRGFLYASRPESLLLAETWHEFVRTFDVILEGAFDHSDQTFEIYFNRRTNPLNFQLYSNGIKLVPHIDFTMQSLPGWVKVTFVKQVEKRVHYILFDSCGSF